MVGPARARQGTEESKSDYCESQLSMFHDAQTRVLRALSLSRSISSRPAGRRAVHPRTSAHYQDGKKRNPQDDKPKELSTRFVSFVFIPRRILRSHRHGFDLLNIPRICVCAHAARACTQ